MTIVINVFSTMVSGAMAQELTQVREDFSRDPGWEGKYNRVVASDPPTVTQDFGWARGRIGGRVWQSRTPAWYGLPFGKPLSFDDAFSVSGKIAVMPGGKGEDWGVGYLGFFNHARQQWRPWNSMAIRLVRTGGRVAFYLDYMSAQWGARGAESNNEIPADGSQHTFKFSYDPNAPAPKWTDTNLRDLLLQQRQTSEEILEKAKQKQPDLTLEELNRKLTAAAADGLVSYYPRAGKNLWTLKRDVEMTAKGAMSLQIDDGLVFKNYVSLQHRGQPLSLDRFGIFNFQIYHGAIELYATDLTINGQRIDLARDPGWQGMGNRVSFVERDFHRLDFGFSETAWCGGDIGEIGGTFFRKEPIDPIHGYYADDIGKLTLDDPISFSGKICFVNGGTDAGMYFGMFNTKDEAKEIADPRAGTPLPNMLGVAIEGPTRIGYYFTPRCQSSDNTGTTIRGPVYLPDRKPTTFTFQYDPKANNGVGQVVASLGDERMTFDLMRAQRQAGATFNRFGLACIRRGGGYVTVYFDELQYTARRPASYQPKPREQSITTVPYPSRGRQF